MKLSKDEKLQKEGLQKLKTFEKGLEKAKTFQKAIILKAELRHINDIWKKHKPQGLGFSDNDAIVLTLKTKAQKKPVKFTETFYCRLKGDGTLGHSMTHASEKRQQNLQKFVKKYISKETRYNLRENISKWKGKEIEIEEIDGSLIIII